MGPIEPAGQSVTTALACPLCLTFVLLLALASSGCADMDQSADDQMNAYHSTGDQQSNGDDHGWGTAISAGGH
jgi:hypothetical protein